MNDLIGLRYGWNCVPGDGSGKTDCFRLVCEVRKRLALPDYAPLFEWVYRDYTEETFSRRLIVRWLLERGTRLDAPVWGAVALLPGSAGAALASVVDGGAVLFIAPSQNVVCSHLPQGVGHYFWMDR